MFQFKKTITQVDISWKKILFLIVLTLFVTRPYFHVGFPYTHDGENHLARFANYKVAVREGQFPPRFAPNLFNHFGYPALNYNYPLANILSVPFSFIKINYEVTFKIEAVAAVFLALLGLEKWLELLGIKDKTRSGALLLFATAPYLLDTIFYRGNIGEIWAISLFIWLFWTVEKVRQEKLSLVVQLLLVVIWTAFFLSHNVTVLFGVPIVFCYAVVRLGKNIQAWKWLSVSFVFSILLSLWFWLPAVLEKSEVVVGDAALSQSFATHFPTLHQLVFSPLKFGYSYIGKVDSVSLGLGLSQIIVLLLATFLVLKNRTRNAVVVCTLLMSWLLVLFQLQFTEAVWKVVPLANYIQFPWRLSLFLCVLIIPVGGYVLQHLPKTGKVLFGVLIFWQILAGLRISPVDYFHRDNLTYENFPQSTSTGNENLPKTFTYIGGGDWHPTPETLSGKADFQIEKWSGSYHKYAISVKEPAVIVEPTMKFLGWQTTAHSTDHSSDIRQVSYLDDKQIGGRIAYKIEPGEYKVETQFTQNTPARLIGNGASTLAVFLGAGYFFYQWRKSRHAHA
jgi:hypothetical protein